MTAVDQYSILSLCAILYITQVEMLLFYLHTASQALEKPTRCVLTCALFYSHNTKSIMTHQNPIVVRLGAHANVSDTNI
jgi:hypothetical protein